MAEERLVEKWRPKSLDEIIGQPKAIRLVKRNVKNGLRAHLLFWGPIGVGKTSVAKCLPKEKPLAEELEKSAPVGGDFVPKNGRELDRDKTREISRAAKSAGRRIYFIDEADGMRKDIQQILRTTLELVTETTFIFSCNDLSDIAEGINSRCSPIPFKKLEDEHIMEIILRVCKGEGWDVSSKEAKKALESLAKHADGDGRKALNILEL
ncbi:hypothetical protein AKJ38_01250 [candidate division MSBL1 archaeon SCGC-AAA259I14]|uniref:AAA+ ATPase domain-containing protein n=1 Tax=candidate division MSBL1 archaeon SCGC-AAA259I14 TaxID=1698268 RepID=A0A133UTB1_9EURY|nr:hypothetical protein AKJ38_01250 [candidate division MSBL1 archaeon SCGC-AAA259I14]